MANVLEQIDAVSLRAYVATQSGIRSVAARLADEERGQSTAEYVAIIVLIVAVGGLVAAFAGGGIRDAITGAISDAFEKLSEITGGGNGGGGGGGGAQ